MTDLDARRAHLEQVGLDRADLADDPMDQLRAWHAEAVAAGVHEPDAMALATVAADGTPSVRHVLCRGMDTGVVFYTNRTSRKGGELAATGRAAVVFPWLALSRQVRVVGPVSVIDDATSDAYFAARPRVSQLGAWASDQSAVLADRDELDRRVAEVESRFGDGPVGRPPHWGGYRIEPAEVQVWQMRQFRLHDSFRYTRRDGTWVIDRLWP